MQFFPGSSSIPIMTETVCALQLHTHTSYNSNQQKQRSSHYWSLYWSSAPAKVVVFGCRCNVGGALELAALVPQTARQSRSIWPSLATFSTVNCNRHLTVTGMKPSWEKKFRGEMNRPLAETDTILSVKFKCCKGKAL